MCEVYARRAGCVRDSTPGGGQTRAGRMPSAVAFPAADGRQDRSDDENAKRRGSREAKCRASYSHRPAERGCKRMPEGNGRIPLRRTAGRSSLRGEAPRRDGRTRQLRPGIAKGEPAGRGDKSFGEAVLAAHGRAELPPRRGPEKGRADPTAAARDREGRSRPPRRKRRPTGPERRRKREEAGRRNAEPPIRTGRPNAVASGCRKETAASPCGARPGGASSEARPREGTGRLGSCGPGPRRAQPAGRAIRVSARPSLRHAVGRSFLRGETPRRDGRIQRIRSETEQADKPRKPETESTEAPLRHVGRSRRGCCCREERNRRARSEEKTHRRRFRNGGKRSAEETGSRRRTEADDRPE